jgi:hypothetical protein
MWRCRSRSKQNDSCWGFVENGLHAAGKVQEAHTLAGQHAKWLRPSLATDEVQDDSITPPPLKDTATPMALSITGISGAVPCWTTTATIAGTESRVVVLA